MRDVAVISFAQSDHKRAVDDRNEVEMLMPVIGEVLGNVDMTIDDIRDLFAYDRWATAKLLAALEGIDQPTWSSVEVIDARGLGGILVHQLGAYQRWRHGLAEDGEMPSPEREPLPTPEQLVARWQAEWPAMDAWLRSDPDLPAGHLRWTRETERYAA